MQVNMAVPKMLSAVDLYVYCKDNFLHWPVPSLFCEIYVMEIKILLFNF